MHLRILFTLLIVVIASGSGWAKPTVEATWQQGSVSVDASADEWLGSMTSLDGSEMHLGVRNDGEYLYLCLYSPDPRTAQRTMMRGLVLQLSVKNGDPIRIQFPIGIFEDGRPPSMAGEQDRERIRERAREGLESFLLLQTDSQDRRRIPVENDLGIEMRTGGESGSFVYEMKLPLAANDAHPYAIGWSSGSINLKIDTPEIDREAMRSQGGMRGGMGGGRSGGMGGGMGGGRSGGMGGDRPQMPEPLHIKARIRLASMPLADEPTATDGSEKP